MLTDIYEINQSKLLELYRFGTKSGNNIIVFGPGGVGKTEMAKQVAQEENIPVRYLNLSVLESPDLVGLPKMSGQSNKTIYATPEFLPLKGEGKPIILLVDELDKAKDEVESPMLELFQFRSINGKPINIKSIIATGNLPKEKAKSKLVSHVLANRCSIYKLKCEFSPWRKWAIQNKINPLVVGYLDQNPQLLLKPNESKDPTAYCYPSPRSWSLGAQELDFYLNKSQKKSKDVVDDPVVDFAFLLLAGRVGTKAALDFKIWIKHYRLLQPVIEKLVKTGEHPSSNLTSDQILVIAMGALAQFRKRLMDNPVVSELEQLSKNIFSWLQEEVVPPDYCLTAIRAVFTQKLMNDYDLLSYQEIYHVVMEKIDTNFDS